MSRGREDCRLRSRGHTRKLRLESMLDGRSGCCVVGCERGRGRDRGAGGESAGGHQWPLGAGEDGVNRCNGWDVWGRNEKGVVGHDTSLVGSGMKDELEVGRTLDRRCNRGVVVAGRWNTLVCSDNDIRWACDEVQVVAEVDRLDLCKRFVEAEEAVGVGYVSEVGVGNESSAGERRGGGELGVAA